MEWVVVTGGARGIGAAVTRRLVADGYGVVGLGRDQARLDAMTAELGDAFAGMSVDLRDSDRLDAVWRELTGDDRRVIGVVNNAGATMVGRAEEVDPAAVGDLFDLNVRATYQCCVGALRAFGGQPGAIVNIASIEAHQATRYMAAYTATKFAVRGLTKGLAVEWARYGVRVNSVSPGAVHTDMTAGLTEGSAGYEHLVRRTPQRRFADPSEIAGTVAYLLGPDASFVTGTDIAVDGGYTA